MSTGVNPGVLGNPANLATIVAGSKIMKRYIIAAAVILAITSGCQDIALFRKDNKTEVYQKWHHTRANVLYKVAQEHLMVGKLDQAHSNATRAVALDENMTDAKVLLGRIYIEQGEYHNAIAQLQEVKRASEDSPRVWYLLGVAQEKADMLQEALNSYQQSYALDNHNISAVHAIVEVLVAMGRIREAQIQVESHISQAKDTPSMYELGGRIAMMREEYASAAQYYRQACDLDPDNVGYLRALAQAQFLSGQYERALDVLQELVENPNSPAWVFAMLGDCLMAQGDAVKARNAYRKAVDKSENSPRLQVKLAKAQLACGDLGGVIVTARNVLSVHPQDRNAAMLLGYALLKANRPQQARDVLNGAIANRDPDAPILCLLGMVNAAAGDKAKATRCYARALQVDPENDLARALLEKLRNDTNVTTYRRDVSMTPDR